MKTASESKKSSTGGSVGFVHGVMRALKRSFCSSIKKVLHLDCESGLAVVIVSGLIIIAGIAMVNLTVEFVKYYFGGESIFFASIGAPKFRDVTDNEEQIETPGIPKADDLVDSDKARCNFIDGNWDVWLGELSQSTKENSQYYLPSDESQGLFKYSKDLPNELICEFIMVPLGERAINFVISFDEFYQIVIGDNDYRTVSLSASPGLGESFVPIREVSSQLTRPWLKGGSIRKGSRVNVVVEQGFVGADKYRVEIIVDYLPDSAENGDRQNQAFAFEFTPSTHVFRKPLELSIGLIRGLGDVSQIALDFITPDLEH